MSNCSNESVTTTGFGELPAFQMIPIAQINRVMCSALGIPLNFLVVAVILRSKQLWSGRNIFWLAVTFFNLLAVLQSVIELCIFYLYRRADGSHQTLCQIYSTFLGYPYTLLLAGLALASWDRYLALARHHFHQYYATPRNISMLLVGVFIVITGGQIWPYWMGIFPIKCGMRYGWVAISLAFQGLLSITCLTVQIKLYIFVRSCIRYPPSSTRTINGSPEVVEHEVSTLPSSLSSSRHLHLQSLGNNSEHRLNQLELRAARVLGTGILPFCLVILTLCVGSVAFFILNYRGLDTNGMSVVMLTFRELLLLHLIYIPAVFVAQSHEFRSALRRCCRFKRPKPAAQQFG